MAIEIIEKKPAELLNRENIVAKVSFDGATPSRADLKKRLAAQLKTDENLVIISKINTAFGKSLAMIKARIYKNEADMKKIERKAVIKKNSKKAEKKEAAEKPAEAPAAKPEEKKEEPKAEEKPAEAKPEEKKEEAAEKPAEK
ncbi:hypothetical protein GF371_01315, partial [Candidatus Woesearchaeota archaeon]|nr:hypothetical protein [Candidatus Woesearchaeota archaeon]